MNKEEQIKELKKKIRKLKMNKTIFNISRGELEKIEKYREDLKALQGK